MCICVCVCVYILYIYFVCIFMLGRTTSKHSKHSKYTLLLASVVQFSRATLHAFYYFNSSLTESASKNRVKNISLNNAHRIRKNIVPDVTALNQYGVYL